MSSRAWFFYGLLVFFAAALALLTRTGTDDGGDNFPSTSSTRGGGLAALKLYLEASGVKTEAIEDDLAKSNWTTLVVAAPTARQLTLAEVSKIDERVRAGATFVYLSADDAEQPHLNGWLLLRKGERLTPNPIAGDPAGTTAAVKLARGPLHGLASLRVGADRGVSSGDPSFLPVAGTDSANVLLWKKHGDGQILIAHGADLAENRRLELLDNRRLWDNLGALGPVSFDELHHQKPPAPPMSVGILMFGAQALFAVLFLTFARGTRLGPPRPLVPQRHRAGIEYAQSFAWLLRGAHAEGALAKDVFERLRRLVHERLGVPLTLPAQEFGREVERRLSLKEGTWERLAEDVTAAHSPSDFARVSAKAAELELAVRGA